MVVKKNDKNSFIQKFSDQIYSQITLLFKSVLFIAPLVMILTFACTVDRSGLARNVISVDPAVLCQGDSSVVSWDMKLPLKQEYCECPNGGYEEKKRCVASSDCREEGARCIDSMCVSARCWEFAISREDVYALEGCRPEFSITITSTPTPLVPPVNESTTEDKGSRSITPAVTTTVTLEEAWYYWYADREREWRELEVYPRETDIVVVLNNEETRSKDFPFECPGWTPVEFKEGSPDYADHLEVISVRNLSGFNVLICREYDDLCVPVSDTESTDAFNAFGGILKGKWFVSVPNPEEDPVLRLLPRPVCGSERLRRGTMNPYPSITDIIFVLKCRDEE